AESGRRLAQRADNGDHAALYLHVVGLRVDGLHGGVGRLQSNTLALAIELLERRLRLSLEPGGHHLAVVGGLGGLHDYDVAVVDQGVDHRIALDANGVDVLVAAQHLGGQRHDVLGRRGERLFRRHRDRLAGSDGAENRHLDDAGTPAARRRQLDAARDLAIAPDQALLLQYAQIVVDDGGGADAAGLLDLADAGRVVVLIDKVPDRPQDTVLLRRKLLHWSPFPVAPLWNVCSLEQV